MLSDETNADLGTSKEVNRELVRMLGIMIQQKRITERLTLEQAAAQSNVSAPTLSRLERQANLKSKSKQGFNMPDTRTIAAVVEWLGVPLSEVLEVGTATSKEQAAIPQITDQLKTLEGIEAFLRADRNLNPQTAAMVAQMFRTAYEQAIEITKGQSSMTSQSQEQNADNSQHTETNTDES